MPVSSVRQLTAEQKNARATISKNLKEAASKVYGKTQ
jgi:hypothetical protein